MRKSFLYLLISVLTFNCSYEQDTKSAESEEIEKLIRQYVTSINTSDTTALAKIWTNEPGQTALNHEASTKGWPYLQSNLHLDDFNGTWQNSRLEISHLSIHPDRDHAWAEFDFTFDGISGPQKSVIHLKGKETQYFKKLNGAWKLTKVNYSIN